MWSALLGPVISGVTGFFKRRQENKQRINDANAAWEAAAGRSMENSWKDEYVTIIVTWPIVQLFVGNLVAAFTGDTRINLANQQSLQELGLLMDTPYGQLMMVVVLAAVGIKGLKVLK